MARGAAGTFVSACLPAGITPSPPKNRGARRASSELEAAPAPRSFQGGVPAVESFPIHIWSRLLARHSRRATAGDLARADPCGDPALRAAIAAYLAVSRGVVARPEQVIVTAGYQGALGLLCAAFPGPQHRAWIEEPGYPFTRRALTLAGLRVQPIPVDDEGIAFAGQRSKAPGPDLVFVTASHQMPLGMRAVARPAPVAARLRARTLRADRRRRLRGRISVRFAAAPRARELGGRWPCDLRGHVQQSHVPGAALGLPRRARRRPRAAPRVSQPCSRPRAGSPPRRRRRTSSVKGIWRVTFDACAGCTPKGARYCSARSPSVPTPSSW